MCAQAGARDCNLCTRARGSDCCTAGRPNRSGSASRIWRRGYCCVQPLRCLSCARR